MLRPFRVDDMITAGGVTGDVIEIGIFAISLNTMDNLRVTVGIGKILSNNIKAPITGKDFFRYQHKAIVEVCTAAGWPVPAPHQAMHALLN